MKNQSKIWEESTRDLAVKLHSSLIISNKNWHKLKSNRKRRAAELISGAIVQLISDGKSSEIQDLLEQSIRWINNEIKDPGCPHH